MKKHVLGVVAFYAIAELFATSKAIAQAVVVIPADLANTEVWIASGYVGTHPTDSTGLDELLASKGSKSGPFHDAVTRDVVAMQGILAKQHVDFGSEIFWDLYRENPKQNATVPVDTSAPSSVVKGAQPSTTGQAVTGAPSETPVTAVPTATDKIMQKAAMDLYSTYASEFTGEKDTDDAFNQFLTKEGVGTETGKLHGLVVQIRSLQKESGVDAGSLELATLLAGNSSSGTIGGGQVGAAQTQPAEVADADKVEYGDLKANEQDVRSKIAALQKTISAAGSTAAVQEAAKALLDEDTLRLNEILAHQAWLRAELATKTANDAVSKATAETKNKLAATAAQTQSDQDYDLVVYTSLNNQLTLQKNAPAAQQSDYVKLKAAEPGLSSTLAAKQTAAKTLQTTVDSANATIANKDGKATAQQIAAAKKTLSENQSKLDSANTEVVTAEKALDKNVTSRKVLRATVEKTDAANEATVDPSDVTRAAAAAAADTETALSDSSSSFNPSTEPKAKFSSVQGYFHTGVTSINSYHITATSATAATAATATTPAVPATPATLSVSPSSTTDTNIFLEFAFSNRWAWNSERLQNVIEKGDIENFKLFDIYQWDVEANLGYTFTSGSTSSPTTSPTTGSTTTNIAGNANTLVGSGNFSADLNVGKPLLFYRSRSDDYAFSVGPEVAYGVVTDRSALNAHPRFFYGGDYTASFEDPFGSLDPDGAKRRVLLNFRGGWAEIDTVHYVPDATGKFTTNDIFSTNNNLPRFFRSRVGAFETELLYPIKNSTFITFGSRIYTGVQPNPWSVQIGITLSLEDAAGSFTSGFLK